MNGQSVVAYMDALESLFVTQSATKLNRIKFNMIKQETTSLQQCMQRGLNVCIEWPTQK